MYQTSVDYTLTTTSLPCNVQIWVTSRSASTFKVNDHLLNQTTLHYWQKL